MARFALLLAGVLGAGCVPGFDEFRVVGGGGDGGARDAGGGGVDSGPPPGDAGGDGAPVLERFESCVGVLRTVLLEESFDVGDEFRVDYGTVNVGGGTAEFPAPQDFALMRSLGAFRDVAACATVRLGRSDGAEENEMHLGLRGLMHGVSLNLVGNEGVATLVSVEPERNVLVDRQDLQWPGGEGTFVMLVFLQDDRIYAEVRNEATRRVVTLSGTYGGVQDDVNVNFEGSSLTTPGYVDHVVAGPPGDVVLARLGE